MKDGGIKGKIIKKYLPLMNQQINKYLQMMDFYINFTLDHYFRILSNQTIYMYFNYFHVKIKYLIYLIFLHFLYDS